MDREDAVAADLVPRRLELVAASDVFARTLRQEEGGVALVQVPDGGRDRERAERANAADAKDELLVQPHLAATDVEDVRDRPVALVVLGDVRVEEEDRRSADLHAPDRDLEVPARQRDADRQRVAVAALDPPERPRPEVVVRVRVFLMAV